MQWTVENNYFADEDVSIAIIFMQGTYIVVSDGVFDSIERYGVDVCVINPGSNGNKW